MDITVDLLGALLHMSKSASAGDLETFLPLHLLAEFILLLLQLEIVEVLLMGICYWLNVSRESLPGRKSRWGPGAAHTSTPLCWPGCAPNPGKKNACRCVIEQGNKQKSHLVKVENKLQV